MDYDTGKLFEKIFEQLEAQTELLLILAKKQAPEEFNKQKTKEGGL